MALGSVLAAGTGILLSVPSAFAHEKGVITLGAKQLAPGGELVIRGAKLGKGSSVRLELRGALATFNFGRVRVDTAGKFEQRVTVPVDARPGEYKVVAVAADGDVAAEANLIVAAAVVAAPATTDTHARMENMPGMGATGGPHATAEAMDVPVATTPAGWLVIAASILLAALGGLVLLRGASPKRMERQAEPTAAP
jgi:hypothetical protein